MIRLTLLRQSTTTIWRVRRIAPPTFLMSTYFYLFWVPMSAGTHSTCPPDVHLGVVAGVGACRRRGRSIYLLIRLFPTVGDDDNRDAHMDDGGKGNV